MKYDLPRASVSMLIIQCFLVLTFTACLYLFLTALQTRKNYASAIVALNQNKQSLNQATEKLDRYLHYISADPFYQRNSLDPQWEKIDEIWGNIPYDKLLERLDNLYRPDRPFVLDFFSVGKKGDEQTTTIVQNGEQRNHNLIFHLQGYFLCPCR